MLKNLTSSSVETTQHDVQKLHTNNNKNNKIDGLFNYIINKEEKIPEEFESVGEDKIVGLLEKYDMLYNQNVIALYTKENLGKVKVITYIVALMAKDNWEHLSNNVSRDMLIKRNYRKLNISNCIIKNYVKLAENIDKYRKLC